jgi:putative transposase
MSVEDENKDEKIADICDLYKRSQDMLKEDKRVVSIDEKTGIQALERIHSDLAMLPGEVERHEFEYIRHGTQTLIASFEVATGRISASSIGETRKEEDFLEHIKRTIRQGQWDTVWHIILDNLNTHCSESLVRWVAKTIGLPKNFDLGEKGKRGVLESMKSRSNFLSDKDHRIIFHYTPKHASWMNQIEIWFGILVRKLLKRSSFKSTDDLKNRIIKFIDYFNRTMSKAFKWTYNGKPLTI